MEQIRSFIAIELSEEVRQSLGRLQNKLKEDGGFPVKWVEPDSIHLTLKFLGNIGRDKVEEITRAMEEAARDTPPFRLEVKGLGVFPDLKRVQVAWVGITGETDRLSQLQRRIDSALAALGFAPETRPFTAHLTLARVRDRASFNERQSFGQLIAATRFDTPHAFTVDSIKLMRSDLTPDGPIYSEIDSIRLKGHLSTASS